MQKRNDYQPGYIYLIYNPATKLYKIGLSRKPLTRLKYLKKAYKSKLKILHTSWVFNMRLVEKSLHKQFGMQNRYQGEIDGGTEWFEFNWWVLPYVKSSMVSKCLLVNAGYVLCAIALIGLIVGIVSLLIGGI